jgi:hypothetical protein
VRYARSSAWPNVTIAPCFNFKTRLKPEFPERVSFVPKRLRRVQDLQLTAASNTSNKPTFRARLREAELTTS